jgi:hypothetical protein
LPDTQHKYGHDLFLNAGDHAHIADPVSPEALEVAGQGLSKTARIVRCGDLLA